MGGGMIEMHNIHPWTKIKKTLTKRDVHVIEVPVGGEMVRHIGEDHGILQHREH